MANQPSPLPPVLAFSFLNSLGTGVVTNGVFFLFRHAYGFDDQSNYLVGIVFGATYVAASLGVGPAARRAVRIYPWLTSRRLLGLTSLALGLTCMIPAAARLLGVWSVWPAWVLAVVYALLTGVLWPVTESYVSGGRSGTALRSAIGRFNIAWASALVIAFWAMSPLLEDHPLSLIVSLGAVHIGSLVLLVAFGREPGAHLPEHLEPHPPAYRDLLVVCRLLLPASYIVLSALSPFLPGALQRLGVAVPWQTPLAATWMLSRLVAFVLLERTHAWHGRWSAVIAGMALLGVGFSAVIVAPRAESVTALVFGLELTGIGVPAMVVGLAVTGVGMGIVYTSALYYAMEVGRAVVDAGGMHEALIGLGYTVGPACMLLASALVPATSEAFEPTVVGIVGVFGLGLAGKAAWNIRRAHLVGEPKG